MVNEIELVNKLKGAGVQPKQAETQVKVMAQYAFENLATKEDMQWVKHRFNELDQKFKDIELQFKEVNLRIDKLDTKLENIEFRLMVKLSGVMIACFTFFGGLFTYIIKYT